MIANVIRIHSMTTNVCTEFHGKWSIGCWDVYSGSKWGTNWPTLPSWRVWYASKNLFVQSVSVLCLSLFHKALREKCSVYLALFSPCAHLDNPCVKWAWLSDCHFWKVTDHPLNISECSPFNLEEDGVSNTIWQFNKHFVCSILMP